jgi:hypothetical protein
MAEALTKIEVEIASKRGPATDDTIHFIKLFHPAISRRDIGRKPRNQFIGEYLDEGQILKPSILVTGYIGERVVGYATLAELSDDGHPGDNQTVSEFTNRPYLLVSSLILNPFRKPESLTQLAVATVALASRVGFHRVQVADVGEPSPAFWSAAGFNYQVPGPSKGETRARLTASLNGHLQTPIDIEPEAIHRLISFRAELTQIGAR